jgi:hypothetical protein
MSDFEERVASIKGIPLEHIQSILKIDSNKPSGLSWITNKNKHGGQKDNCGNAYIDKKCGYKYWQITIRYNKKRYCMRCSRIVFLLANGYLTKGKEVDHIDCNTSNNNLENLREVTPSQNQHNRSINKNNTSGHKGVYWEKTVKKWRVRIKLKRKNYDFGFYENLEEAVQVMTSERARLHGEFGRDR